MSRRKPAPAPDPAPTGPRPGVLRDVPGEDVPSPEVLDELLKAFSADNLDTGTLRKVDFDSPEVEQLLAPTAPTPGPGEVVDTAATGTAADEVVTADAADGLVAPPEVEAETDAEVEPEVEVEVEPDAIVGPEPGSPEQDPPPETDTDIDIAAAAPSEPAATSEAESPAAAESSEPEASPSRTIVIDASHDPPDAVYLAAGDPLLGAAPGGAAAAGSAPPAAAAPDGTVFIDDDAIDDPGTITVADASSATRIEPRLRERRIAVKRAAGRKRLRWVLVVALVLVVIVAALAVLGSSLFSIEDVKVQGAVYADRDGAVSAIAAELEGQPVLRVDTDAAERRLEAIPWVESARVITDFPSGASIELRERTPTITYLAPDGRYRVLDDKGRVLDVLDGQPVDYLLLVAADATDLDAGQFAPQGYIAAASLARSLPPDVRARAESLTVTGDGSDLRLQLSGDIEVRFGPARDLVTKLVRLQVKLPEVDDGGVRYVDVSTDEVTVG